MLPADDFVKSTPSVDVFVKNNAFGGHLRTAEGFVFTKSSAEGDGVTKSSAEAIGIYKIRPPKALSLRNCRPQALFMPVW